MYKQYTFSGREGRVLHLGCTFFKISNKIFNHKINIFLVQEGGWMDGSPDRHHLTAELKRPLKENTLRTKEKQLLQGRRYANPH
jgi:hypothetical protein